MKRIIVTINDIQIPVIVESSGDWYIDDPEQELTADFGEKQFQQIHVEITKLLACNPPPFVV